MEKKEGERTGCYVRRIGEISVFTVCNNCNAQFINCIASATCTLREKGRRNCCVVKKDDHSYKHIMELRRILFVLALIVACTFAELDGDVHVLSKNDFDDFVADDVCILFALMGLLLSSSCCRFL